MMHPTQKNVPVQREENSGSLSQKMGTSQIQIPWSDCSMMRPAGSSRILVSNVERFALHDGPGIRTTIFFMGCPLHCPWCANPETWQTRIQLLHDAGKCIQCRRCTSLSEACTWNAEPDGKSGTIEIHQDQYDGRDEILHACPAHALSRSGQWMDLEELFALVEKDRPYYDKSDGGITLSGGEPLLFPWMFLPVVQEAKKRRLNVYVETTGNVPLEHFQAVHLYVDGFLFDLKHPDASVLRAVTGAELDRIQENLQWLIQDNPHNITLRVPVIPGFNDDRLDDILHLAAAWQIERVHFLPFHNLGKNKWHLLHRPYAYEKQSSMEPSALEASVQQGRSMGLHVQIGG